MFRKTFAAAAVAAFVVAAHPATAQDLPQQIDQYAEARVALGQFNGVILVIKDDEVVFERAYGWASIEHGARNRPDTLFNVASITKQFTAAAVLQLRDAGKLQLTDSVCAYVDPCPEAWRSATLRNLLNHTSGIPDYEEALELFSPDYTAFISRPDNVERILAEARGKPLDFAPGSKFHYSNTGYILLSRVISKVSGMSYEQYVESQVLAPAGMTSSRIDDGLVVPGAAQGYAARELPLATMLAGVKFEDLPLMPRTPGDLSGDHGDASLWTTARDLARWVQALEDGRIVSAASLREMKEGGAHGYGYGLEVGETAGRKRIRHTGATNGFVSVLQWYPDQDVIMVVLSNYIGSRLSPTMRDLTAMVFDTPYDLPRAQAIVERDPATYQPLIGDYVFDGSPGKMSVNAEGMLILEVPGRFTAGFLPLAGGAFYVPFLEAVARPTADGFVIRRQGADLQLTRKPAS